MVSATAALPRGGAVTLWALFRGFFLISLLAFGGPLVWARRILVERLGWLSDLEFAEILGFCQFLPGPAMVSVTVCVGTKFRGGAGALAALAGFIVIPVALGVALGAVYLHYAQYAIVQHALHGISVVAAGLLIGTGLRLLRPYLRKPVALGFAALAFALLILLHLPLLVVMVGLVPFGVAAAWRDRAGRI